jgi:hypothetical protein
MPSVGRWRDKEPWWQLLDIDRYGIAVRGERLEAERLNRGAGIESSWLARERDF